MAMRQLVLHMITSIDGFISTHDDAEIHTHNGTRRCRGARTFTLRLVQPNCRVVAVELGANLAAVATRTLAAQSDLLVMVAVGQSRSSG
jgi:hypothetical protein